MAGVESAANGSTTQTTPTVIVDNLHVTYRIHGERRVRESMSSSGSVARQLLSRARHPQGNHGMQLIKAVRGVSFVAHRGEAIGLIGRNGSGKSTLMQALAGLLPADHGMVYTSAQPSLLGVNAALMNDLTGERNIRLGGLAMGMTPAQVEEKLPGIVEFAGIGDFVGLPMRTYSAGMGARLRFAIAASVSHDILLIDEALSTGDADFRERSRDRIEELRKEAGTVFLVSHSLSVVAETCSRAIWLDAGQIKMDGPAAEVTERYTAEVAAMRAAKRAARGLGPRGGRRPRIDPRLAP